MSGDHPARRPASSAEDHRGGVVVLWAGAGLLVGVVAAVVVRDGPWWAASLAHYAGPYMALLCLIGVTAPGSRDAVFRAAACFAAFVVACYAVVALQFGAVPVLYAGAWLTAAVTVCPAAAAVVRWASGRPGAATAFVAASAGAVAVSDGSVGNIVRLVVGRTDAQSFPPVLFLTGPAGLLVALGAALRIPRDVRTRLAALALLVPLAAVSTYVGWAVYFGNGPYL